MRDDGWDWPWLLFFGIVILGITEEKFWALTPRKFCSLVKCYEQYQKMKNSDKPSVKKDVTSGYIDQIKGW